MLCFSSLPVSLLIPALRGLSQKIYVPTKKYIVTMACPSNDPLRSAQCSPSIFLASNLTSGCFFPFPPYDVCAISFIIASLLVLIRTKWQCARQDLACNQTIWSVLLSFGAIEGCEAREFIYQICLIVGRACARRNPSPWGHCRTMKIP